MRRFALAFGLLLAVLASQLPEFVQQYRQRLGGTLDEVRRALAVFDAEAAAQHLSREAGIARLKANPDDLARSRGADLDIDAERERRLAAQERGFAEAGPVSQYWVFLSDFDATLASRTYAIFQPAVPVTPAGLGAAAVGLAAGWGGVHAVGSPFRRRRKVPAGDAVA